MNTGEKIRAFTEEILHGTDKFLVDFVSQPANRYTVFIDGDKGITIDDCQFLSRVIGQHFDRDQEDFELTVSSAGLDHPLKIERQYRKNIGRELNVSTKDGKNTEGILVRVDEAGIELEHPVKKPGKELKKENSRIPFSAINKAKIIITFGK